VVNNKSSLIVYCYTLLIIILSLVPIPNLKIPEFNLIQTDKLIHVIVYFVMFLIWVKSNILKDNNLKFKTLIVVFLISFSLEFLQGTSFIKRYFLTGLLVSAPIGATIYITIFIVEFISVFVTRCTIFVIKSLYRFLIDMSI